MAVGGELIARGDHGAEMYVIQSGRVRITKQMGGREVVLGDLGPGDFFGEMSLLESLPTPTRSPSGRRSCWCSMRARCWALAPRPDVRPRDAPPPERSGAHAQRRAREGARHERDRRLSVIIDACEDRLYVISDLHLGNPSSTARGRLVEFLDYARITRTSVCINGDGFEMLQTSLATRLRCRAGAQRCAGSCTTATARTTSSATTTSRSNTSSRTGCSPRSFSTCARRVAHPHRARPPLRPLVRALPEGLRAGARGSA